MLETMHKITTFRTKVESFVLRDQLDMRNCTEKNLPHKVSVKTDAKHMKKLQ